MEFTQANLDAINRALTSGTLTVESAEGDKITYRSVSELLRIRDLIKSDLGKGRVTSSTLSFVRG